MEKIINGLTREKAYEIKEAIDSFHKNLVVIVDDDKLTIKDLDWSEVKRALEQLDEIEHRCNERFIREYQRLHSEV